MQNVPGDTARHTMKDDAQATSLVQNVPDLPGGNPTQTLSDRLFDARQSVPRRVLAGRSGFSEAQLVRLERAGPLEGEDVARLLVVLDELEREQSSGAGALEPQPDPEPEPIAVSAPAPDPSPVSEPEEAPVPVRRRRSHRYRPRP